MHGGVAPGPVGSTVIGGVRGPILRPGHRGIAGVFGPRARCGPSPGPGGHHHPRSGIDGGGRTPSRWGVGGEAAGVRLRRASLTATLAAQRTEIPQVTAAGGAGATRGADPVGPAEVVVGPVRPFRPRTRVVPAPDSDDPRLRLLTLTGALVAHDPPTVVGPIDAAGAADALLAFLIRHGYLDTEPVGEKAATAGTR